MANIYTDPIDVRIKRVADALSGRDYEGTIQLLTSDVIEILDHIKLDRKVDRFEVVDENGRIYSRRDVSIDRSYQDGGKTLKVFVEKSE